MTSLSLSIAVTNYEGRSRGRASATPPSIRSSQLSSVFTSFCHPLYHFPSSLFSAVTTHSCRVDLSNFRALLQNRFGDSSRRRVLRGERAKRTAATSKKKGVEKKRGFGEKKNKIKGGNTTRRGAISSPLVPRFIEFRSGGSRITGFHRLPITGSDEEGQWLQLSRASVPRTGSRSQGPLLHRRPTP